MALLKAEELLNFYERRIRKPQFLILICLKPVP